MSDRLKEIKERLRSTGPRSNDAIVLLTVDLPWLLDEVERLTAYVGSNMCRSDYQTVDDMRKHLDALKAQLTKIRDGLKSISEWVGPNYPGIRAKIAYLVKEEQ